MGTFKLKVRRNLQSAALPVAVAPAAAAAPAPAPAAPSAANYISMDEPTPEDSIDEAMLYVAAPKVSHCSLWVHSGCMGLGPA